MVPEIFGKARGNQISFNTAAPNNIDTPTIINNCSFFQITIVSLDFSLLLSFYISFLLHLQLSRMSTQKVVI